MKQISLIRNYLEFICMAFVCLVIWIGSKLNPKGKASK